MDPDALRRLARVADMAFDAEAAKLRGIRGRIAAIGRDLATMRKETVSLKDIAAPGSCIPAKRIATLERWRNREIARLQREIAGLAAEEDVQEARVSRAFGRAAVLGKLLNEGHRRKT